MNLIDPFPGHYDASDPFGSMSGGRRYPHTGSDWNRGLNNAPIPAIGTGTVVAAGFNSGNGNYLCTRLEDGHYLAYLHLRDSANFSAGDTVNIGATVGVVGATGTNAIGPHLHVTVSDSPQAFLGMGNKINPWDFIQANLNGTPGAPAAQAGRDQDVINRQNYLNATFGETLAVDGRVGPNTKAAIARYQTILGVTADGAWGPATQAAHQAYYDARHQPVQAPAAVAPAPVSSGRASVSNGSIGQDVTDVQTVLNRNYPLYSNLTVDGQFGPGTEAVVREFQTRAGLTVDGIVGPATYAALGL